MPQTAAEPALPRRTLRRDGLMLLSAAVSVSAVAWFAVVAVAPVGPLLAGWILNPLCALIPAALCFRTGYARGVEPAAASFWRGAGWALTVFSCALVWSAVDAANAGGTVTARSSVPSVVLKGVSLALLIWPLLRLPLGTKTRTQRVALWLDIATLMIGTAVFVWHFVVTPALDDPTRSGLAVFASVPLVAAGLVCVFVVAKVALTGAQSLERGALRLLGGGFFLGIVGAGLTALIVRRPYLDSGLLVVPVVFFLIGLGARRQLTVAVAPDTAGIRAGGYRRRRYSVLPYLAVAATHALLVTVMLQDSTDRYLIANVATALTGLVVARQIMGFRENEKLLARLGLKEQRFRLLVQNSTDVVSISGTDGMIDYISDAVYHVLGHTPESMLRTDMTPLLHPDDLEQVATSIEHVMLRPGNTATYRVRMAHADGTWRCLEVISANLSDEPSVAGIVSNARDVTETLQVQERLSYEASHDALTGLANRTLFSDRISASIGEPGAGRSISLVLIDLDDFKTVNDTLGHPVGDGLLVAVAQRMRDSVRPTDTVARLGGDEFAILMVGLGSDAVDGVLTRIADKLQEPMDVDGHVLSVRASFGVVEGGDGDDAADLLRQADIAMYEAKERGEGGHQRYRSGMQARGAERNRLTAALRAALDDQQFVLHYQPVVAMPGGRLTGVEALVRWQHPERGLLGPGEFIADAEQTGMIVPLGRWILREACHQAASWQAECGDESPETVSVNVSARQLQEPGFAAEVADALRGSGLPARRLTIEITESTAVGGDVTQAALRSLRAMGVRISLDDFGTGASTLSLLATCPVDQIKLDRSFAPVPGPDAIANAVVQLAKAFGVEVIAEGVETAAQARRLQHLGYVRAQGFLFARPMPPAALSETIRRRTGDERTAA